MRGKNQNALFLKKCESRTFQHPNLSSGEFFKLCFSPFFFNYTAKCFQQQTAFQEQLKNNVNENSDNDYNSQLFVYTLRL